MESVRLAAIFGLILVLSEVNGHNFEVKSTLQNKLHDVDDKTWLFAVSGRRKPFNFLSPNGKLQGFDVDLVHSVCSIARKKCRITLAEFKECTFTNRDINYPGRGLMAEWFDACPGYVLTVDRLNGFDFTLPYLNTVSTFTVLPGNPVDFDPTSDDFSNFTITHLNGAATNAKCLNRLGKRFNNITIAENLPQARAFLEYGRADVLFSPRRNISGLEVLPEKFHCDINGVGIMAKKGSHLLKWWNRAFAKMFHSGHFRRLCKNASKKYQYNINCIEKLPHRYMKLKKPVISKNSLLK